MGQRHSGGLAFTRTDLQNATKHVERRYDAVDPDECYRALSTRLERFRDGDEQTFIAEDDQGSGFRVDEEDESDDVTARLAASSRPEDLTSATISYRPYGPYGALAIVLGLVLLAAGAVGEVLLAGLGGAVAVAGVYGYVKTDEGEVPVEREEVVRVLLEGSRRGGSGSVADLTVDYAGDVTLHVSGAELSETDWVLQRAVVAQVDRWYDDLAPDADVEVTEGFLADLKAPFAKDQQYDWRTVTHRQEDLFSDFETRLEYTELILDELPEEAEFEVYESRELLLDELEAVAADVERALDEGRTRVE